MMRARIWLVLALGALLWGGPSSAQRLVWVDNFYGSPQLSEANLDGSGLLNFPLGAGTLPEGITLDPSTETFYLADAAWTAGTVRRVGGGLGAPVVAFADSGSILGLAWDTAAGKLYWTTTNRGHGPVLRSADASGGGRATLHAFPMLSTPRGVVVDPFRQKIYTADFARGVIESFNLDGSGAATVTAAPAPWGLALDAGANVLYWTEYGTTGSLRRLQLGGGSPTTLATGLAYPTDLALDVAGGALYCFLASSSATIVRYSFANLGVTTFASVGHGYGGLVVDPRRSAGVGPGEPPAPPAELAFGPATPTPTRGGVRFALALPRAARVTLAITDVSGRTVATPADENMGAGSRLLAWDGRTADGPAAPGLYFARLRVEGHESVRRVVIAR